MKKTIVVLIALAVLVLGVLKITRSINVDQKIKQEVKPWATQSQDNRDPKDINSSAESRKGRKEDQLQR